MKTENKQPETILDGLKIMNNNLLESLNDINETLEFISHQLEHVNEKLGDQHD
tara:strand:- start:100 stop:258 length:159 start_codon:yes stop_codon:yes gene_type:complete